MPFRSLSIPFWSDFNENHRRNKIGINIPFNPILVWFQLGQSHVYATANNALSIPSWSDFNFTVFFADPAPICETFNPILVWFQLFLKRLGYNCPPLFQSHLGLISTLTIATDVQLPKNALSIPSWSDFNSKLQNMSWATHLPFNPILVWFQLQKSRTTFQTRKTLSIPSWSDFNASFSE